MDGEPGPWNFSRLPSAMKINRHTPWLCLLLSHSISFRGISRCLFKLFHKQFKLKANSGWFYNSDTQVRCSANPPVWSLSALTAKGATLHRPIDSRGVSVHKIWFSVSGLRWLHPVMTSVFLRFNLVYRLRHCLLTEWFLFTRRTHSQLNVTFEVWLLKCWISTSWSEHFPFMKIFGKLDLNDTVLTCSVVLRTTALLKFYQQEGRRLREDIH